jgi:hypothetical protein
MSKKPTIAGRIGSTKTLLSTTSTSVVAVRPTANKHGLGRLAAICSGILSLLVFAGIGIYFTAKQRALRSAARPPVPVAEAASNGAPAPIDYVPPSSFEQPVASAGPVRTAREVLPPLRLEPEQLASPKRELTETTVIEEAPFDPGAVAVEKPRPEPTIEPKQPPGPLIADAGNDQPKPKVAVRLSVTEPPVRDPRCQSFGTKIDFFTTRAPAYEVAKKENKLVLNVHYAGAFENGAFTSEKAEEHRQKCLCAEEVAEFLKPGFVCVCESIGSLRQVNGMKPAGNVVSYFCRTDGSVLHAIPGPVSADVFLAEARWLLEMRKHAQAEHRKDPARYTPAIRKAHSDRYFDEAGNVAKAPNAAAPVAPPALVMRLGRWKWLAVAGFGGLPGFAPVGPMMPIAPLPDLQPPANRLPTKRPDELPAQVQVHWLLAGWKGPLPTVNEIYKKVYEEILKERICLQ